MSQASISYRDLIYTRLAMSQYRLRIKYIPYTNIYQSNIPIPSYRCINSTLFQDLFFGSTTRPLPYLSIRSNGSVKWNTSYSYLPVPKAREVSCDEFTKWPCSIQEHGCCVDFSPSYLYILSWILSIPSVTQELALVFTSTHWFPLIFPTHGRVM